MLSCSVREMMRTRINNDTEKRNGCPGAEVHSNRGGTGCVCVCSEKKRRIGKRTGLLALGTGRKNSLESGPEADKQVPEER